MSKNLIGLKEVGMTSVGEVGGKNASLGEMIRHLTALGVRVPNGFATTAYAFREFLKQNQLNQKIEEALNRLDVNRVKQLAEVGAQIRQWIMEAPFLPHFEKEIISAYESLCQEESSISVAVRSSATAEDLPGASFAGQQETYLNVSGSSQVLLAVKQVFASLYNDRAIAYRVHQGFSHEKVAISACVQRMVRSDLASSGVMFTIDTESGFRDVILINAAYGLGELVVQGAVNPDEYYVFKPSLKENRSSIIRKNLGEKAVRMVFSPALKHQCAGVSTEPVDETQRLSFALTDHDITELAQYGLWIENHYQQPMDIEWAKDGLDGKIYIVQARPETVKSRKTSQALRQFELKERGKLLAAGRSVGQQIGQGTARVLKNIAEMNKVKAGDVLVTDMTDPDWEPIMKIASAIVTNRGGRTCHAAIVARELGIPAVVGTQHATEIIHDGQPITVCCAEGDVGSVYEGLLKFEIKDLAIESMPEIPTKIMMNVGEPDRAFEHSFIPNAGVGLARIEFIINTMIGIHPRALLHFKELPEDLKKTISEKVAAYESPIEFYIEKLREGIAMIGAAFYPKPVIVRTSDFKTNEYANLLGGSLYEPKEENPMIGFRGASRYVDASFRDCFRLECEAVKRVRHDMGLTNVEVMIPFTRTVDEAKRVIDLMAECGLKRGENGLRVIMMCEIPSNAVLAEEFLQYFDGFSIGSNDLTQLTLGLDRDSSIIAYLFDERNEAVKYFLSRAISVCNQMGKYIGICGQGPSDYPDLAQWLLEQGIGSMSLNPDTVVKTWLYLAKKA